jgi:HAD superfamily hydrolase (TIGR01459 family)
MTGIAPSYPTLSAALKAHQFPVLFLDAWGVFWAGNAHGAFPGSQQTMEAIVGLGKKIGIVSNSTERSDIEIAKFAGHGFKKGEHFHFLITSGDVARSLFTSNTFTFPTPNKKYALFCPQHPCYSKPSSMFAGTLWRETYDFSEADFIYINVPNIDGKNQEDKEVFRPLVQQFLQFKKPMVCANPDLYAHEESPPRPVVRQGTIAAMYEEMGGQVYYIGKPYHQIYSAAFDCLQAIRPTEKGEILMVGDTPETDIRGARSFGINAALITHTGIMAERILKQKDEALQKLPATDTPRIFIERFAVASP